MRALAKSPCHDGTLAGNQRKTALPGRERTAHRRKSGRELTTGETVRVPRRSVCQNLGRIRVRSRSRPPGPRAVRRRNASIPAPSSHWPCSRPPRRIPVQGRRNVSHRSANRKTKFSRLRCSRTQGRCARHHCRTQHPIPHAAHKPFLPAGASSRSRSGFLR